ncbi:mechanosensitive ion channel family protein [Numidum massiliense]|uniref:mechanosensitive ion channel family protein n=1 Tax=Numidum massiliense TaxID=1522315 RepID=UPI0006D56007|nr:mechanosensitive ion channel family protein [Numidum massiliense]
MEEFVTSLQKYFMENEIVVKYVLPAIAPAVKIALIIVGSFLILRYSGAFVDRLFKLRSIDEKKSETLAKLLRSVIYYAVYFVAALTILINLGIDLMPLLAGAGIVGLAVGFGAQNLVRDIITGFFLIFEGQLHVGDFVEVNGTISGTVEEIGLRITKIREWNQRLHYISNGEISRITNYNREQMRPIVTVAVPFEADQEKVERVLEQTCRSVYDAHTPFFLEEPSIYGVTELATDGVHYTIIALTVPEQFWFIERELRKTIIDKFQTAGIEISYPRRVVYTPRTENGTTDEDAHYSAFTERQ